MKKLPEIYGFNECSEVGPDTFAPSFFLSACNLRCPYCMNSKLIERTPKLKEIDLNEIKENLIQDKPSEWVMISGGEPTCTDIALLENLIVEIKSWGFKIGMSTNGTNVNSLRCVIRHLEYVAIDIKAADPIIYSKIGSGSSFENVVLSKALLAAEKSNRKDFDYEIRTTLYPPFINKQSMEEISSMIWQCEKWILQQFRHTKNMLCENAYKVTPYSQEEMKELVAIAKRATSHVELRHV